MLQQRNGLEVVGNINILESSQLQILTVSGLSFIVNGQ